jgi:hypothetical protein
MKEDEMGRSCGMDGGEILNSVLVETPAEMRPLETARRRFEDNIKMVLK